MSPPPTPDHWSFKGNGCKTLDERAVRTFSPLLSLLLHHFISTHEQIVSPVVAIRKEQWDVKASSLSFCAWFSLHSVNLQSEVVMSREREETGWSLHFLTGYRSSCSWIAYDVNYASQCLLWIQESCILHGLYFQQRESVCVLERERESIRERESSKCITKEWGTPVQLWSVVDLGKGVITSAT